MSADNKFITVIDFCKLKQISTSLFYAGVKSYGFPKFTIFKKRRMYQIHDLEKWLDYIKNTD